METGNRLEVAPSFVKGEYMRLLGGHLECLKKACTDSFMDYRLLTSTEPLDEALFAYLLLRERSGGAARRNQPGGAR